MYYNDSIINIVVVIAITTTVLLACYRKGRKRVVSDDSDDDVADTKATSASSKRELQAKVSQLETMFPNMSRGLLEEALNFSNGDYEGAVDHIMQQQATMDKGLLFVDVSEYYL